LHGLFFGVPGHRPRRSDGFRGPCPAGSACQTALDARNDPDKVASALEHAGIFNCVSCYKCEEACPAKIPIVSQVIEPLKAKTAKLRPGLAKHSLTFKAIIASRGRIDPTELVLRIQGMKAVRNMARALRLLIAGKISPLRTLFKKRTGAAAAARRLLSQKDVGQS